MEDGFVFVDQAGVQPRTPFDWLGFDSVWRPRAQRLLRGIRRSRWPSGCRDLRTCGTGFEITTSSHVTLLRSFRFASFLELCCAGRLRDSRAAREPAAGPVGNCTRSAALVPMRPLVCRSSAKQTHQLMRCCRLQKLLLRVRRSTNHHESLFEAFRVTDDDMLRRSRGLALTGPDCSEFGKTGCGVRSITSSGCTACCCLLQARATLAATGCNVAT